MSGCVADTHALVWYVLAMKELSKTGKTYMENVAKTGGKIFVPTISIVEVTFLVERNRYPISFLNALIATVRNPQLEFEVIELTIDIAENLGKIPRQTVPEMPDRIIAATALTLNLPLITADHKIQAVNTITTIW
jgi:PIN domain nuclease of toxin-antitoxin system